MRDDLFADYAEPGRLFNDQEYFARTQPRPGIFATWTELLSKVAVLIALGCAGTAFGRMIYFAYFKRY